MLAVKLGARATGHSLPRGPTSASRAPGLQVSGGREKALGCSSCPGTQMPPQPVTPPHVALPPSPFSASSATAGGVRCGRSWHTPPPPTPTPLLLSPGRSTWRPSRWRLCSDWPASFCRQDRPQRASGSRGAPPACVREDSKWGQADSGNAAGMSREGAGALGHQQGILFPSPELKRTFLGPDVTTASGGGVRSRSRGRLHPTGKAPRGRRDREGRARRP